MAYVNVRDWSVEQVTEWLKGLDSVIAPYIQSFLNNEVKGNQLLSLRSDDLEHLGVYIIGHQEIILEAVEHLRNFHYKLDKENLQMLSLSLSCAANSLYKELSLTDENCTMVPTQTMSDVHNIITAIKQLVCWLDRSPFRGDKEYVDCKTQLLQLSFEMATSAHRDIFSEKPLRTIRNISNILTGLADHIVQEITDPMILQPASLALATLKKKKEQELGFFLVPSNYAVHQIAEIKYGSPAHNSSKIEEGDEIVQVNYQTVVGWQRKNVLFLLQESPPEIVLTLKKRPRHTKVYGQIYMKPYRLPSKKQATPYSRWNDNLPSPQLLAIYDLPQILTPRLPAVIQPETETEISSSSDSEPLDSPLEKSGRVYPIKPRPVLQRRNTVTGASPTNKKPHQAIEQYWQQLKNQAAYKHSSSYNIESDKYKEESSLLRDKSVSCNDGFQLSTRPNTVIGLSPNTSFNNRDSVRNSKKKKVNFEDKPDVDPNNQIKSCVSTNSLNSLHETLDYIDEGDDITDRSSMKINWQTEIIEEIINSINYEAIPLQNRNSTKHSVQNDAALADVKVHNIIKKFDCPIQTKPVLKPKVFPKNLVEKPPELPVKPSFAKKPAIPPKNIKYGVVRGTLNKSNSAPAYDATAEDQLRPKEFDKLFTNEPEIEKVNIKYDNTPIKYELGIPLVETSITTPLMFKTSPKLEDSNSDPSSISDSPSKCLLTPLDTKKLCESNLFPRNNSSESIIFEELPLESNVTLKNTESIENLNSGNFEARNASTPILKSSKLEFPEVDISSSKPNYKAISSDNKISPTNSIVRAMMYSSKNKATKKKNSLAAKRRKVAVKDVTPGEMQGYLHQRSRSKQIQRVNWEKRWFVLNGSYLYGFESKDAIKAKCLIFLSGFTVSIANEVKSRCNAFKVYHTGTVFYFSVEDCENLLSWIESITAATLIYSESKLLDSLLYSESEDDFESDKNRFPQNEEIKKFGSLKKVSPSKNDVAQSGSSSLDRKWFFNKANKNALPVPTAQFRSYRKIPSSPCSVSTGNFTSHIPDFSPTFESSPTNTQEVESSTVKVTKIKKSLNYAHASNPNLCEIGDFQVRAFNKPFQQCSENLAGFVTLEELMIRQSEDQKLNPYNVHENTPINPNSICPDVVYGEVPIRPNELKPQVHNKSPQMEEGSFCFGKRSSLKKQKKQKETYDTNTYPKTNAGDELNTSRSLPRQQKLNEVEKSKKKFFAKKEYSVSYVDLKDHSETSDDKKHEKTKKIIRQRSLTSSDKKDSAGKFWIDSWKRSDKVTDKSILKLKSADQYTPMSLPLVPDQKGKLNPKFAFELNLDEKVSKSGKILNFFSKQDKKDRQVYEFHKEYRHNLQYEPPQRSFDNYYSEDLCHSYNQPVTTMQNTQTIDYPGLEYPPIFEPETYSLSDPQSNISILRKQDRNN